jgi:uncharacterized membrane protein
LFSKKSNDKSILYILVAEIFATITIYKMIKYQEKKLMKEMHRIATQTR